MTSLTKVPGSNQHVRLATALLPMATIHVCFLVSLLEGHFDACNPYWMDCVSISKSGRYGSAYWVFKAGMLPTAVLLVIFWFQSKRWLSLLDLSLPRAFSYLALTGSVSLSAYTLALGHAGDEFRLIRRAGVMLFIFCEFLCQLLTARALLAHADLYKDGINLIRFSALILLLAIFSLVLNMTIENYYDRLENMFEWWLMMLLLVHLILLSRVKQRYEASSKYGSA